MNTRSFLLATGIAGVLMALFSTLPFISVANCCLCLWLWTGGILAVFLYRKFANVSGPLTISQGLLLGLVAGIISAVIGAVVEAVVGPYSWGIINDLVSRVGGLQDTMGPILEMTRAGGGGFSFVTLIMNLLIYSFFGLIGGMLGTVIFKGQKEPVA
jgi:hypothetical protein